jgi:hypothetical protein
VLCGKQEAEGRVLMTQGSNRVHDVGPRGIGGRSPGPCSLHRTTAHHILVSLSGTACSNQASCPVLLFLFRVSIAALLCMRPETGYKCNS